VAAANTGILVDQGQEVEIRAAGQWRNGPLRSHVRGPDALRIAIGQAGKPPLQVLPGKDVVKFRAESRGLLFLGIFDQSVNDNSGELTVEVTVR
jgi:hypothetical protein